MDDTSLLGSSFLQTWKPVSKWWHWSYWIEWSVLIIVTLSIWAAVEYTPPHCGFFDPLDPALNYPYTHHPTFPSSTLPVVSVIMPIFWWICFEVFMFCFIRSTRGFKLHLLHSVFLASCEAVLFAMCITDPLKNYAGRPRPDYVSRLREEIDFNPRNYTPNIFQEICDSTNSVIKDYIYHSW